MPRLGLRARVAALCALLGFVVSACLALVAVHFSDSYVHRLIDEMLRVEGDYLRERYSADGVVPHPRTKHFYAFVGTPQADSGVPADLAVLRPGVHEVQDAHGERHVAVYDVDAHRLYVVLDIGLESVRERRLSRDLTALVLFGGALSAWLGWFFAGRAIDPVRRLAREVETLDPARRIGPLAQEFARDEVGTLARAFDRYRENLHAYVRRERAFTADASHELRTPLAVIRGAIEVLLDSAATDAATAARLKRMQRGVDELRDLLDALLALARSDEPDSHDARTPDLNALVDELLRERRDTLGEKHLQLERSGDAGAVAVSAPQRLLRVVVANLLRAATQFAEGGRLRVAVTAGSLSITHLVEPLAPGGGAKLAKAALDQREQILGLGMVRRLCERWGWALDEDVASDGAHAFILRFG